MKIQTYILLFLLLFGGSTSAIKKDTIKMAWPVNTRNGDRGPSITADGTTLIFESERDGTLGSYDIYESHWKKGRWSRPLNLRTLNTRYYEGHARISSDGKTLFLSSNRATKDSEDKDLDIFVSKRNLQGIWTSPISVEELNSSKHDSSASLSFDQKFIYFCSNRSGGKGDKDIWQAQLIKGKWTNLKSLPEPINSSDDDCHPEISAASDQLYFTSNRSGGKGGYDIYRVFRTSIKSKWSSPQTISGKINTSEDEYYFSIPSSGNSIYIARGENNRENIFEHLLEEKHHPTRVVVLQGKVLDIQDTFPISNAQIKFSTNKDTTVGQINFHPPKKFSVLSEKGTGRYFVTLYAKVTYNIGIAYEDYQFYRDQVSYKTNEKGLPRFRDFLLTNKPLIDDFAGVYFRSGSHNLTDEAKIAIKLYLPYLMNNRLKKIYVTGYADPLGGYKYNQKLSKLRAQTVVKFLEKNAIDKKRIILKIGPRRKNISSDNVIKLHYLRTTQIKLEK